MTVFQKAAAAPMFGWFLFLLQCFFLTTTTTTTTSLFVNAGQLRGTKEQLQQQAVDVDPRVSVSTAVRDFVRRGNPNTTANEIIDATFAALAEYLAEHPDGNDDGDGKDGDTNSQAA